MFDGVLHCFCYVITIFLVSNVLTFFPPRRGDAQNVKARSVFSLNHLYHTTTLQKVKSSNESKKKHSKNQKKNDKQKGTILKYTCQKKIEEGHSIERIWYSASREPSDTFPELAEVNI